MLDDIIADAEDRMGKAIDALKSDLMSIRTGRASPGLVDKLMVEYYGTPTPLLQLATISAPDAKLLTIRPFSPTDISDIERAIIASDLGITPSNDGAQIRLVIPDLTEERRRDLTKQVSKRAEEARVSIRNIRRDAISDLRDMEKESMISEDELHRGQDKVQEKTDECVKQVDEVARGKEEEIMTI